nr:hypothetical protein CFP56_08333 [Quercus suber]
MKVYHGFLQDIPVLVKCFLKTDERFWSTLKILSRVRHRHIRNIFGYCCADDSVFLLCDCSCMDTVEVNLQWEILESPGQGEVNPRELELEIKKKRGQYQSDLQPFYQLCKMNEVKLEVQFAAGFRPCQLAVEEAQKSNARWVILDSHFKKFKEDIRAHINCNLAVVKGKDIAAIMTSTAVQNENFETFLRKRNHLHSCQILKVLVDIHCLGEVVFHELLITVN